MSCLYRFVCLAALLLTITQCIELVKNEVKDAAARNALCNDGSPAVFFTYRRPDVGAPWHVYLEGGGDCFSVQNCEERWRNARFLMTSTETQASIIKKDGVFSSDCSQNAPFCKSNVAVIHYCSSDRWAGDREASPRETGNFTFRGKNIVHSVVEDLIEDFQMLSASRIILGGSSAGGSGTMNNVDRIGTLIRSALEKRGRKPEEIDYRGIPDSGWYADGPTMRDAGWNVGLEDDYRNGSMLWNLQPNEGCANEYGPEDLWRCEF